MREFDEAIHNNGDNVSIASDYVGTLADEPRLYNILAIEKFENGNNVSLLSTAPPEGLLLSIFEKVAKENIKLPISNKEFLDFCTFSKKVEVDSDNKPHFNIVIDDQDVNWCTYDYHIIAGSQAFEEFLKLHEKHQCENIMDIVKELSSNFTGNGINIGEPTVRQHMTKEP